MNNEDNKVQEWEAGLPAPEELIPLTQSLITTRLASAFKITPAPPTSDEEVKIASEYTVATLHPQENSSSSLDAHPSSSFHEENNNLPGDPFTAEVTAGNGGSLPGRGYVVKEFHLEAGLWNQGADQISVYQHKISGDYEDGIPAPNSTVYVPLERRTDNGYGSEMGAAADSSECGGSGKKRLDLEFEDADSSACVENSSEEPSARTLKRPRLVWTPQLHKRFVDAVAHLGIKNAVPKTIMQLMNVDGLTRENVASHLQKYRLYLKRMQGLSSEGPSVSDQLFATTPVPPSLAASGHFLSNHGEDLIPLLMAMPMAGRGHGRMVAPLGHAAPYSSFDHHTYNALARSSSQKLPSGDEEHVMDNQHRPGSPQRQVLTLFPTSGN